VSDTDLQLTATAYHEAGHVVARFHTGLSMRQATIVPSGDGASPGRVAFHFPHGWEGWTDDAQLTRLQKEVITVLAGPISEERHTGKPSELAGQDQYDAAQWLQGHSEDLELQQALGNWLELRTRKMIEANWDLVGHVAEALLEHRTLTGTQVADVCREGMRKRIAARRMGPPSPEP
jgi:ATP-dependent Zn protease